MLHQSLPRRNQDHRQRHHPSKRARRRRILRPPPPPLQTKKRRLTTRKKRGLTTLSPPLANHFKPPHQPWTERSVPFFFPTCHLFFLDVSQVFTAGLHIDVYWSHVRPETHLARGHPRSSLQSRTLSSSQRTVASREHLPRHPPRRTRASARPGHAPLKPHRPIRQRRRHHHRPRSASAPQRRIRTRLLRRHHLRAMGRFLAPPRLAWRRIHRLRVPSRSHAALRTRRNPPPLRQRRRPLTLEHLRPHPDAKSRVAPPRRRSLRTRLRGLTGLFPSASTPNRDRKEAVERPVSHRPTPPAYSNSLSRRRKTKY